MAAVRERERDPRRSMHHVTVREHQAIGSEYESGTAALAFAGLTIARAASGLCDFDLGNRRAYFFRGRDHCA